MDLITAVIDLLSAGVLVFLVFVGSRAVRAFRQSKQAVIESASLLEIIVSALASRVEASESLVTDLRYGFEDINHRSADLEHGQSGLRANYQQMLQYLQEGLSNDRRLILELEHLKTRLTPIREPTRAESVPKHGQTGRMSVSTGDVLAALTPTERHTLEILSREGPKAAPELGRRMRKSREHMARLMKKLYLEGYVDRESNHAPFRYRLNEKIGSLLGPSEKSVTEEPLEKA